MFEDLQERTTARKLGWDDGEKGEEEEEDEENEEGERGR